MFHLRPRTCPPAALPARTMGALISFSLRLSPPPPPAPALSPAPTPRRPPIFRNLRIPLRPPHRLPPHPARLSWFVPASPRIPPLAILPQQATPSAPPLRPLLPAVRPPPRHLAVNPLHLWLRAPGHRLRGTRGISFMFAIFKEIPLSVCSGTRGRLAKAAAPDPRVSAATAQLPYGDNTSLTPPRHPPLPGRALLGSHSRSRSPNHGPLLRP